MSNKASAGDAASPKSAISVLLIDDQAFVGEVMRRLLAGEPDIALHACTEARAATELAHRIKPDVILQDLVMPDIDGLDQVRAWRADALTAQVPIIVLSAKEEPVVKRAAFIAGANDYLVKLPDTIELVARIRYHAESFLTLRQRDEALDFLSHDMRSPQASILALVDAYRSEHGGTVPPILERIETHARRALALADGFIHLTRAQSGKRPSDVVNLNDVAVDAADQLWDAARGFGSRVSVDVPRKRCVAIGDRMMLTRAVANLIDNALKYGPAGAGVRCSVAADGDGWLIGVEDAGSGIAHEYRASAAEPYVRFARPGGPPRSGFGLGLAFVRATAAKHGGEIVMRDVPGGFFAGLRLPRADPAG